ncbi:hypothetical protein [Myxosarcina sp. GI1(2024)]
MGKYLANKLLKTTEQNLLSRKAEILHGELFKPIAPRLLVALLTFITIHSSPVFNPPHPLFKSLSLGDNLAVAGNELNNVDLITLPTPPFEREPPGKVETQYTPVNLNVLSVTGNNITDDHAWFANNNLSLPTYEIPNLSRDLAINLPDRIPQTFNDSILVKVIRYPHKEYLIYGNNYGDGKYLFIYDLENQKFTSGYDFSNYLSPPDYSTANGDFTDQSLTWVVLEDNVLYVSNRHRTYAESSQGMNGYLTAIDLDTNQILWRSKPLVCNTENFVIINRVIVCGYGFTAEPDYLYSIDKENGEILQQINLKTAPNYIIPKDDILLVRTYDTNYVFEIIQQY